MRSRKTLKAFAASQQNHESTLDVETFFAPLVNICSRFGLLDASGKHDSCCEKAVCCFQLTGKTIFLTLVWIWTLGMSVNIFYAAITSSEQLSEDGHHPNMIIQLLEESPYSFITLRSAVIFTLFFAHSEKIYKAILDMSGLQKRLTLSCGKVSLEKFRYRPWLFISVSVLVIVCWEFHEWSVWFFTYGLYFQWDFKPFPVVIPQWMYALCWTLFTTIPFVFSQLALCFPVLFAYTTRKFLRFINKELGNLGRMAKLTDDDTDEVIREQVSRRLVTLRTAHFELNKSFQKVNDAVAGLLLVQFLADVVIIFGFIGLLVNSKNRTPRMSELEWTFCMASALVWFFFFLFNFTFPLIHLSEEAERTHHLVHSLTFASPKLLRENFNHIRLFLNEVREATLAFTGGHFYYITRHYVVTCVAVIASYVTVLSEILDRYYSTEEIKNTMGHIARMLKNGTDLGLMDSPWTTRAHIK